MSADRPTVEQQLKDLAAAPLPSGPLQYFAKVDRAIEDIRAAALPSHT